MKLFYSPKYNINLGRHVFPTIKYKLVHDRLLAEGVAREEDFIDPGPASDEDLRLVHTSEYIEKLKTGKFTIFETMKMEVPYCNEFQEPCWICANGTIQACKEALKSGVGIHIGGGFHHAYPDHGEGFCIVNDIAVGIKRCLKDNDIKKAMVIDCDLHQGNGTAFIFQNEPDVFTFSIHQEYNYPVKEKSDLDIGLDDYAGDEEYLGKLREVIPKIIIEFKPGLIIYVAGVDPYEKDQLGGLSLTIEGLKKRDELVINQVKRLQIPIAIVFGGGYAKKVEDTVLIHTNTVKVALGLSLNNP